MLSAPRIAVLPSDLADQIAAGEVVERPASVVKELVENAIDAGAGRVDVRLTGGGLESITVIDDGVGMHPEDLPLALQRHATSKVKSVDDLLEITSLGFRGEALASIVAVAHVRLKSRVPDRELGAELLAMPGGALDVQPVGMPGGTQVDVRGLFANVPARKKFLRSEASEVARCSEAMLKIGLIHPSVRLSLHHGERRLIDLPAATFGERVCHVLERRAPAPFHDFYGEYDGVTVRCWMAHPVHSARARHDVTVVVRRRVVRERSVAQVVVQAVQGWWGAEVHPVACIVVDPVWGGVDVNVHPQKSEVRFREPQVVYAAVRRIVADGLAAAPWRPTSAPRGSPRYESMQQSGAGGVAADAGHGHAGSGRPVSYRLHTRATRDDYDDQKHRWREAVQDLSSTTPDERERELVRAGGGPTADDNRPHPELLTCLPGPVGIFRWGDDLLAVDLRRVRAYLLERRLRRDLGGGPLASQGLLTPMVVPRDGADIEALMQARDRLLRLGLDVEAFGSDAVVVRAVPAHLQDCVDEADLSDLMDRVIPWLRLSDTSGWQEPEAGAVRAIAATAGADPAPRLARRWIRELVEEGVAPETVSGIRRLTPSELLRLTSQSP